MKNGKIIGIDEVVEKNGDRYGGEKIED